jgi:hypothetical protein
VPPKTTTKKIKHVMVVTEIEKNARRGPPKELGIIASKMVKL